ncbi:MAG: hypothetical protein HY898_31970 [Deltaproteobacteria bacterium]|nr:hypothetical protein [Deltaproteobacteria bacterium]
MTLQQYEVQIHDQRSSALTSKCIETGEGAHASGLTSEIVDWNLARCYFRAGRYKDALVTASGIQRNFVDKHALLAACHAELGDPNKAIDEFERAVMAGYRTQDETLRPNLIRALGAAGQRGLLVTASYFVNRAADFNADLKLLQGQQPWTLTTLDASTRVQVDRPVYVLARVQLAALETTEDRQATTGYGDEWIAVRQLTGYEKKIRLRTAHHEGSMGSIYIAPSNSTYQSVENDPVYKPVMQHTGLTSLVKFAGMRADLVQTSGYVVLAKLAGAVANGVGRRQASLPVLDVIHVWTVPDLIVPPTAKPVHDGPRPAADKPPPPTW